MSGYSQKARHRVGWAITAIESVVQIYHHHLASNSSVRIATAVLCQKQLTCVHDYGVIKSKYCFYPGLLRAA